LPYYEELGYGKLNGINYFNPNIQSNYQGNTTQKYQKCEYLTANPKYDASGNNPMETNHGNFGNVKFYQCYLSGTKITNAVQELNDGKCYCYKHKNLIIKQHNKKIHDAAKEEKKAQKLLEKENAKKEKELAKAKAKEEKENKKLKGKKNVIINGEENVVISVATEKPLVETEEIAEMNSILLPGCVEILKTGANKGTQCGCKIVNDNLCKRHYNLKNKNNI